MKEIFLHICCAPCFLYPFKALSDKGYIIRGFFFNPNIHPLDEYGLRKRSLESFVLTKDTSLIVGSYDIENFFDIYTREKDRCYNCYYLRIEKTAQKARELGIKTFSTTLLYSKRQKHEQIKEICYKIADIYGLEFYYEDFREGWSWGIEESKKQKLYRQKYCGCLFSYKERFEGRIL